MARTARITKIDRRGARCTLVNYRATGEKSQVEIAGGMPEFRQWIREQLKDSTETLIAIALAQWLAKNPGSTDFSGIEGKTITLNLEAIANTGIITIL